MRVDGVDVLRGIAAIAVVFFHVLYLSGVQYGEVYFSYVYRFDFFVRIFFVISAFSMMLAYNKRIVDIFDIKSFYIKRFFRIAPLFYFFIILSLFLKEDLNYKDLLSVFFIFPFFPGAHESVVSGGWSIGVEVVFYILFPLFLCFFDTLNKSIIGFLVALFVAIVNYHFYKNSNLFSDSSWAVLNFFAHAQYFFVGLLVYFLFLKNKVENNIFILPLFFSMISICLIFKFQLKMHEEIFLSFFSGVCVYSSTRIKSSIFVNNFTKLLGELSYSIYFSHFLIISIFHKLNLFAFFNSVEFFYLDKSFIAGFVVVCITIVLSKLLNTIIEKPFLRIGAKISVITKNNYV